MNFIIGDGESSRARMSPEITERFARTLHEAHEIHRIGAARTLKCVALSPSP